jgi:hypothetical protein
MHRTASRTACATSLGFAALQVAMATQAPRDRPMFMLPCLSTGLSVTTEIGNRPGGPRSTAETCRQAGTTSRNISARLCKSRYKTQYDPQTELAPSHDSGDAVRSGRTSSNGRVPKNCQNTKITKKQEIRIDQTHPTVNQHDLDHQTSEEFTLSPARLPTRIQKLGKPPVTQQASYQLNPTTTSRLTSNPA